jgi:hypothetical protein
LRFRHQSHAGINIGIFQGALRHTTQGKLGHKGAAECAPFLPQGKSKVVALNTATTTGTKRKQKARREGRRKVGAAFVCITDPALTGWANVCRAYGA